MSKLTLLTDLDGVSLNWLDGFCRYMENVQGHQAIHQSPENFSMIDIFPELEKPYVHITDYHHSEFYRDIKPYTGSIDGYETLRDMGVEIIAITSCGEEKKVQDYRMGHIDKYFGHVIDDAILLPLGVSKEEALSKFDNSVFIDDQMINAIAGAKTNHDSFIWDMSYNKKEEQPLDVKRAYNWDCLVEHFSNKIKNKKTIKIRP